MLNKNAPFAEVFGKTENGCRFVQDDIEYAVDGMPCEQQSEAGKKALIQKKKEAEAMLKAAKAAEEAVGS